MGKLNEYGFVASVLPVWLLLATRDYLSTFLKVGTISLLAIGILIARPNLRMPPVTRFIDGSGPVWAGSLFPFLFSVRGRLRLALAQRLRQHAKMIENENQIPFIGYGRILMESLVAIVGQRFGARLTMRPLERSVGHRVLCCVYTEPCRRAVCGPPRNVAIGRCSLTRCRKRILSV